MIDAPWRWTNWSPANNWRSPESKYKTMTIEEIAALPVADLLRPGGVAWVWGTWPILAQGDLAAVIRCWGLRGVTGGAWAKRTINGKLRWGTGFLQRSVCEPYILAIKGASNGGVRGRGVTNLITVSDGALVDGLAREHSRKPDEAYAVLRTMVGEDAKIADIFSREKRKGFVSFGDQVDRFVAIPKANR